MKQGERGYALLLVFALAAAIAVMLYRELPRAAFESQRMREEMLIERGEEYKRAIQLYVAKNKKYPANLDDLEKTSGIRFLRRRYKDPMTGEDEWRLVHIDNFGQLTDSLIEKKDKKDEYQNAFISEGPTIGATTGTGQGVVNRALIKRASDQEGAPGTLGEMAAEKPAGDTALENVPQAPADPNAPAPVPADPNAPPPDPSKPKPPDSNVQVKPDTLGPVDPATGLPRVPKEGQQQPAQNAAVTGIMDQLRKPNPNFAPGQGGQAAGGPRGAGIPGGLAGVASKLEADSIKIYGERQRYNEWEFVYQVSKDQKRGGGTGQPQTGQPQTGGPGGAPPPPPSK